MSTSQVVIQGTLQHDGTLQLDEKPSLPPGRVQVILQVMSEPSPAGLGWWDILQQIWKEQEARGDPGRSLEEMEAEEAAQRAEEQEYEERWRRIWDQTQKPPPPKEMP